MYPRDRRMLRSKFRVRLPAGIEQHQDRSNVMLCGDGKKRVEAGLESFRILFPELILKKHTDRVHPDRLRHSQLSVIQCRVERRCLEHLQFVDGVGRDIVCANEPGLLRIPLVCTFRAPTFRFRWRRGAQGQSPEQTNQHCTCKN